MKEGFFVNPYASRLKEEDQERLVQLAKEDGPYHEAEKGPLPEEIQKQCLLAGKLIRDEFKRLGLRVPAPPDLSRIGEISLKVFNRMYPDNKGITFDAHQTVFLSSPMKTVDELRKRTRRLFGKGKKEDSSFLDRVRKTEMFFVILHEMLHLYAAIKVFEGPYQAKDGEVDHRGGFHMDMSLNKKRAYFMGFNEAFVENMCSDIVKRRQKTIEKALGFELDPAFDDYLTYDRERSIQNDIFLQLARNGNQTRKNIFDTFQRDYFTSGNGALRKLEKGLAPGALRVIAPLGTVNRRRKLTEADDHTDFLIEAWLKTKDPKEKDQYAKRLLPRREYMKYRSRVSSVKSNPKRTPSAS